MKRVFIPPNFFLILSFFNVLFFFFFLSSTRALVILRDTNEKLNNTDFWFMPNDYDVTSTLVRAEFEDGQGCKVKISYEAEGRILFFVRADFKAAGCYFYDQTIHAVKEMKPLVSIYESAGVSDDIGYVAGESYGNLPLYSDSGLALTLVNNASAAKMMKALQAAGPVNISVSHDVGNWVRFASSPWFLAYVVVYDICYGFILIYCLYRLALYLREFKMSVPFILFVCCSVCCLFRILDLSVNPLLLRNNTPVWVRFFLFWVGCVFGYVIFVMIGNSWMKLGKHLNISPWMGKYTGHLIRFSYYSIGHFAVTAILIVVQMAYPGSAPFLTVVLIAYYAIIPIIIIEVLLLAGFGAQIVILLQKSAAENTSRSRLAYRKISLLLISSVLGFLVIAINIGIDVIETIVIGMINNWIRDAAAIWLLLSIVFAMNLHSGRETTKKEITAESTSRKTQPEKTELESFAVE